MRISELQIDDFVKCVCEDKLFDGKYGIVIPAKSHPKKAIILFDGSLVFGDDNDPDEWELVFRQRPSASNKREAFETSFVWTQFKKSHPILSRLHIVKTACRRGYFGGFADGMRDQIEADARHNRETNELMSKNVVPQLPVN